MRPQIARTTMKKSFHNDRYPLVSRDRNPSGTVVSVGQARFGMAHEFTIIAGPCAVESIEQIDQSARLVKSAGAHVLRAGCFKPRTSPYSFQGLGIEGLALLAEVRRKYSLPVVSEVNAAEDIAAVADAVDMLQIGARNMQNFRLLQAVGRAGKPVLLKRGMNATIEELLLAAEYLLVEGNDQVVLCERGIRTFETSTRNTLDINAIPVLQERTHLPVIVDPSHACGVRDYVPALCRGIKAVGAHGLMIEVHPDPDNALSDGAQSLYPADFARLMKEISAQQGTPSPETQILSSCHVSTSQILWPALS